MKTKNISLISSDLTWLPGHKKRFAFVNRVIGHFKDKIDVFGRGFNEIPDKFDALIDYKYTVAIENNSIPGYFTEKISECFLTYTMPVYYGCPNIDEYYNSNSFLRINIDDYKDALNKIENLLAADPYSERIPFIQDSRKKFLTEYHVFPAIIRLVQRINVRSSENSAKRNIKIQPEDNFLKSTKEIAVLNNTFSVRQSGKLFLNSILRKFI